MQKIDAGMVLDTLKLALMVHGGFLRLDADKQEKTRSFLRSKGAASLARSSLVYVLRELDQTPGGSALSSAIRQAQKSTGSDVVLRLDHMGKVAPRIMALLQTHSGVLEALAGEHEPGFRRLAQAARHPNPIGMLKMIARIPAASPSLMWVSSTVRRIVVTVTNEDLSEEEKHALSAQEARHASRAIKIANLGSVATDPMTPGGAEAVEKVIEAQNIASQVSGEQDAASPLAAKRVLADLNAEGSSNVSGVARTLGLSPEQEYAMIDEGRVLIGAGAGSGKTRVLAGKVVYHIKEKKIPARSVIATSFTKKSAGELKERILAYGGTDILDGAEGYVGTTHSVALSLQREYGPKGRADIVTEGLQKILVEIAIKQVGMSSEISVDPPQKSRSILDELTHIAGLGVQGGRDQRIKSLYWQQPANQWWNLGTRELSDEEGNPIGVKQATTEISKWKGQLISPSEAWSETKSGMAAVYAAYEWLKRNDPQSVGKQDFDDILVDGVRLLARDKNARQAIQQRFKVVLVDEAQDQNNLQNVLFGLITGSIDPVTLKDRADGQMTAQTYCKIGDDKQCCHLDTEIQTRQGVKLARDLQAGDEVLAYRNGKICYQPVRAFPSSWKNGYRIETERRGIIVSPNHKIWASRPVLRPGQVLVYLMYREDLGFRVGITNKGADGAKYLDSFGGRAFLEKAERMWFLKICDSREEALFQEEVVSLTYGVDRKSVV